MRILFVVLLASVVFAGCASKDKKDDPMEPAKLVKFETSAKLKKVWSRKAGDGQDKRYSRFVPAVTRSAVYIADVDGRVYAFDALKGKRIWKTSLKKDISAAISEADGQLYLGTYDGEIIALNAENGDVLWEKQASSEISSIPTSNGRIVVAQSIDGGVMGLNAKDGEKVWTFDHPVPILTLRGAASPVFAGQKVLLPFESGQIVALSASEGVSLWEARVGQPKGSTELDKIVDVDSSPLVIGQTIYAATYQGSIGAFEEGQGRPMWKKPLSTYTDLAYDSGKVFASSEDSTVYAFNSINGNEEWRNELLHRRDIKAPAVIGDYVAVIDKKGYLHLLKQEDGSFAYRFKPSGDDFRSPMISANSMLYILADNGRITAYKLK